METKTYTNMIELHTHVLKIDKRNAVILMVTAFLLIIIVYNIVNFLRFK